MDDFCYYLIVKPQCAGMLLETSLNMLVIVNFVPTPSKGIGPPVRKLMSCQSPQDMTSASQEMT